MKLAKAHNYTFRLLLIAFKSVHVVHIRLKAVLAGETSGLRAERFYIYSHSRDNGTVKSDLHFS
jgi:hypothetical protein